MTQLPEDLRKLVEDYRRLVILLESNYKYIHSTGTDERILCVYKRLLHFLKHRDVKRIAEILGETKFTAPHLPKSFFSDEQIRSMSSEQIKELASDLSVTRKQLEQVASVRFGVTRGGLSNLRNRDALVDKLLTLVRNERTHESIARVVDSGGSKDETQRTNSSKAH